MNVQQAVCPPIPFESHTGMLIIGMQLQRELPVKIETCFTLRIVPITMRRVWLGTLGERPSATSSLLTQARALIWSYLKVGGGEGCYHS